MIKPYFLFVIALLVSVFSRAQAPHTTSSWAEFQSKKSGTVQVIWFEMKPFVFLENGTVQGIEHELVEDFFRFVRVKYGYNIKVEWVQQTSFQDAYNTIKNSQEPGQFGVSSFSLTSERLKEVKFSPTYMPDISVLICSENIPLTDNLDHFKKEFSKLKGLTIKQTTFEQDLLNLKREHLPNMSISYLPSDNHVVQEISSNNNYFGYCGLPLYIMALQDGHKLKRQNFFQVKRDGYSILYTLHSDWEEPLKAYFEQASTHEKVNALLAKYLGQEATDLIWEAKNWNNAPSSTTEISILNKEKDIQQHRLMQTSLRAERQKFIIYGGSAFAALLVVSLLILYRSNKNKKRSNDLLKKKQLEIERINKMLNEKYHEIELQKEDIDQKNTQLESANKNLIWLNEEKNDLIEVLAHDLRNPISQISGLLNLLQLDANNLTKDQIEIIQKMSHSSTRLSEMLNRILDIESIESKGTNITLKVVDIVPIVRDAVESLRDLAAQKQTKIKLNSPLNNVYLNVDSAFLSQVLENLINNSIKFSPTSSIVTVTIDSLTPNTVEIIVADNGPGINQSDQKKIFSKYSQLSNKPTGNEKSTGLGLSIVKKYVEAMNGKVWYQEQPAGACFVIEFKV